MDDREWMYKGWQSEQEYVEFALKVNGFLKKAFDRGQSRIHQSQLSMGKHIIRNGFVENYTRWICHGEAHRAREEVVSQRIDDYDADAGCADMLADFHEAHFQEVPREEPPEPTAKQYYDMLSAAQKPLHGHTNVSQFDPIARVLALKSECGISRDGFDKMLTVFGSLLPEGHILPKSMYEAQKLLRSLKMPYEKIHACPKVP